MIKNSLILLIILTFTGCISITKEIPAYSTYTINVNNVLTTSKNSSNITIAVTEPKTLTSINSKYILYSTKNYTSEHYAFSKWSDNPSKMIQMQIVKYLSSTNHYKLINSSRINTRSNYRLLSEIDTFHQYFNKEKSFIEFTIRVYLKNKKSTNYKTFTYIQPCEKNNALEAVKAFNISVNTFVQDLDKWILNKTQ